jgi:hypothetical protein
MGNRTKDASGLEALRAATHPARDAAGFRAIQAALIQVDDAERALREAVRSARQAGDSWAIIGAALGTSRQAAFQRFSEDS